MSADAPQRAGVAQQLGLQKLSQFIGRITIRRAGKFGARVDGQVEADLVQACVVTLEPVPARVSFKVERIYQPPLTGGAGGNAGDNEGLPEEIQMDDETPEPLIGGGIDLGALLVEELSLAIDPYPRAPGATFAGSGEGRDAESPFAALARLKAPRPSHGDGCTGRRGAKPRR